jgi:hypothetical protein
MQEKPRHTLKKIQYHTSYYHALAITKHKDANATPN